MENRTTVNQRNARMIQAEANFANTSLTLRKATKALDKSDPVQALEHLKYAFIHLASMEANASVLRSEERRKTLESLAVVIRGSVDRAWDRAIAALEVDRG